MVSGDLFWVRLVRLGLSAGKKDGDYKNKIAIALKEIEIQRRELEGSEGQALREEAEALRLDREGAPGEEQVQGERLRQRAHRAQEDHQDSRGERARPNPGLAAASEHHGGRGRDGPRGDRLQVAEVVSKTMEGFVPALDATSASINNTLTETMAQMGQISPGDNRGRPHRERRGAGRAGQEVRRGAGREAQGEPARDAEQVRAEITQTEDHIPHPRDRRRRRGGEPDTRHHLLGAGPDPKVESEVLRYAIAHNGVIDISETSMNLGIPQDEVEHSMIRLVAAGQGKVTAQE